MSHIIKADEKITLYCSPQRHLGLKRGWGGGGGEVGKRNTKRMIQKRLKGNPGKNSKLSSRLLKENHNFEFAPIKISK